MTTERLPLMTVIGKHAQMALQCIDAPRSKALFDDTVHYLMEIRSAQTELETLRRERERLDYAEAFFETVAHTVAGWRYWDGLSHSWKPAKSFRDAIDARRGCRNEIDTAIAKEGE